MMTVKNSVRSGGYTLAELVVDPARITGTDCPWSSVLVVPLDLVLPGQPKEQTFVVQEFVAELWLPAQGQPQLELAAPLRLRGGSGHAGS